MNKKILVVLTSATELKLKDGRIHKTGYFLGEFTEPLFDFLQEEFDFDVATLNGKTPQVDKDSERWIYWVGKGKMKKWGQELVLGPKVQSPMDLTKLTEEDLKKYCALFVPGGHGPMVDLAQDLHFGKVLTYFHKQDLPIGMICHAPVALGAAAQDESFLFKDYKVTVFSNLEEIFAQTFFLGGQVPYLPSNRLRTMGVKVKNCKIPFMSHVVVDRKLVTGQNPYSTRKFAQALIKEIKKR